MEYQHAAVDQYARNVSPNIQEFVGYSSQKNAAVSLEFGQGAFRFGHSTLRETIDTIDPTHGLTGKIMGYALRDAFLSPEKYAGVGPAAILLGMSHQQMNEVDEFVTPALNQGLLGQPLDLAAINIARGRDIGMPALNDFREAIGLAKYTSWTDFSQNMQHPTSLANFIAAYSLDGDLATAKAIVGLADGTIAEGDAAAHGLTALYASDFLSGSDLGFGNIDTWLGGMAEIHQPGGLLGETFDAVFVSQIEALMDGDRFYYLFRTAGQQFGDEIGNAQLKDIVERNTGLTHLNGNIFGYADKYVELAAQKEVLDPQNSKAELLTTGNEHKYGDVYDTSGHFVRQGALAKYPALGIYSNGGLGNAQDGSVITINGQQYIRDTRMADDATHQINGGLNLDGTPNSGADSNEVIVATDRDDLIYGQGGDDTLYLDGGNDKAYGGFGIDRVYGGLGNDELHGGDNPDLMDGGAGDDTLFGDSSGSDINGSDQLIGGSGDDELHGGTGIDKLFGGTGDDAIYGEQDTDPFTHGNDGNDYVDGGSGGDILYGDNGDDVLVGGADQDQVFGGRGDDILRPGDITGALTIGTDEVLGGDGVTDEGNAPGTTGFDLIDFSDNAVRRGGVSFDLSLQGNPGTTINGTPTQIAAFQLEGVIGSAGDDNIKGDTGDNWIIGGSGNDVFTTDFGNDVIIGGSIRLDTLIGKYQSLPGVLSTYDHNANNNGLTAEEQLNDARYAGASHRVGYLDSLATSGVNAGIIDAANTQFEGVQYAKHFTEMLRSNQFKDLVLGDAAGTALAGKNDLLILPGARDDFTVNHVSFAGHNVFEISLDGIGTDLVIDVDSFRFTNGTYSVADMLNLPPVFDTPNAQPFEFNENLPIVAVAAAIKAHDPEGDALVYSISAGNLLIGGQPLFRIDSTTGVVTFAQVPDYEALKGVAGVFGAFDNLSASFSVVLAVSDGLNTTKRDFTFKVDNLDEPATGGVSIVNAVENAASVAMPNGSLTLTASSNIVDPDLGGVAAVVTYQLQSATDGTNWALVSGASSTTGALTVALPTLATQYRMTATYSDVFGTHTLLSPQKVVVGTASANTLSAAEADVGFVLALAVAHSEVRDDQPVAVEAGDEGVDDGSLGVVRQLFHREICGNDPSHIRLMRFAAIAAGGVGDSPQ
jgi:Ca2+-binding RTX toxin-like protein